MESDGDALKSNNGNDYQVSSSQFEKKEVMETVSKPWKPSNTVSLLFMLVASSAAFATIYIWNGETKNSAAVAIKGLTNDKKHLVSSFDRIVTTADTENESLHSLRRRASDSNNEVMTIQSGCGETIPKSTVVTVYEKLLNGDSAINIEWEDCADSDNKEDNGAPETSSLRLPATKKANGQFYTFTNDDDGTTIALACDDVETNICDVIVKVVSDEAPVLPDITAPDDKIPDKITIRLLDPLHDIPAEGEFNPAKRIGLGFVSLLGPDIARVSKIEFTSFIDGQPTHTFHQVSTNIPSPLLFSDGFDSEATDENLEYGSVFYGENNSTKGAYVNMIASSSGGNLRALVNDGVNGYSITRVDGIVKYSCSELKDLVDPEEPLEEDLLGTRHRRQLHSIGENPRLPHQVTPLLISNSTNELTSHRKLQSCRNVGGVPSGSWNAGWSNKGQVWDCSYFERNNMCSKSDSYPNFGNWVARDACCGCGGGVSTACQNLRPSGREWSISNGAYKCSQFESWGNWCDKYGSYVGRGGLGAKQACCVCGGGDSGSQRPTPSPQPRPQPTTPAPVPTGNSGGGSTTCSDERPGNKKWSLSGGRYACSDFAKYTNWCRRYGEYRGRGGIGAIDACCTCGGGVIEETPQEPEPTPSPPPPRPSPTPPTSPTRSPPTAPTISYLVDVLVVYTTEAMKNNPGGRERDMVNFINGLATDTNTALSNSGSTVRINIAGTHHNEEFTNDRDGALSNDGWINMLSNTRDGNFDYETNELRDQLNADLVMLLGEHVPTGKAYIQGVYGVARRYIADIGLAFAHEVGHMLGALHNAEENQIYDPSYYDGSNLGYIDRRNCFRTIMSYPDRVGCQNAGCSGGSCAIVMYFSNTVATYNGHPTGNSRANNAKYIDSKGRKSSSWE